MEEKRRLKGRRGKEKAKKTKQQKYVLAFPKRK